jgi:hypothetical protein
MASKLFCCLDADQGARERGKADGKLKWTRYYNFGSAADEKPRGLIPTLLFDLHQIE